MAEAVKLAAGSLDNIIKPSENILIKPNLAFQAPPESFAVVDPRVVELLPTTCGQTFAVDGGYAMV